MILQYVQKYYKVVVRKYRNKTNCIVYAQKYYQLHYNTVVQNIWCLDDPSTHKPTTQQLNPHYPSTQWTVCYDNSTHFYIYMICSGAFCPPRLWGGRFVTCDMTSSILKMLCDIMSTLSWSEMWTFFHRMFWHVCDVYGQSDRTEVHQPMYQWPCALT